MTVTWVVDDEEGQEGVQKMCMGLARAVTGLTVFWVTSIFGKAALVVERSNQGGTSGKEPAKKVAVLFTPLPD